MTDELKDSEIFRKAAKLVKHGWTTSALARDKSGKECDPTSPEAANFCAAGAILSACGGGGAREERLRWEFRRYVGQPLLSNWNDGPFQTQKNVAKRLKSMAKNLEMCGR